MVSLTNRMVMVALAAFSQAAALVSISHDTTWGPDSVKIADNVTVDSGVTLTVAPAGRVVFGNNCGMQVKGRLLAVGTLSDSVSFSAVSGSSNYWNGIHFSKTPWTNDTSKFVYCSVRGVGWSMTSPGAIAADSFSRLIIAHSTIANNGGSGGLLTGGGIYLRHANPLIENVRVINNKADGSLSNGGGLYCDNANPFIVNTLFWGNSASGAAARGWGNLLPGVKSNACQLHHCKQQGDRCRVVRRRTSLPVRFESEAHKLHRVGQPDRRDAGFRYDMRAPV